MKSPPVHNLCLQAFSIIFFLTFSCVQLVGNKDTSEQGGRTFAVDTVNSYGFFIGNGWNKHLADFQKLPGIPNCCKGFKNGVGNGLSFGAFMEIPLPYGLYAGMRVAYQRLDGWLKEGESTWVRVDKDTVIGLFEHNLKVQYSTLGFEPNVRWNFLFGASLFLGARVAFPIQKKFQQWELLVQPSDRGVFVDTQSRRRNEYSGDIPDAKSVQADFHFGLEYALPLNKARSLLLVPMFIYRFALTNVVNLLDWKINSYQLQLALRYRPIETIKPKEVKPIDEFERKYIVDTIIVENEHVRNNRFAFGKEKTDSTMVIEPGRIIHKLTISRRDTIYRVPKPVAKITTNRSSIHLSTQFVTQAFPLLPILFYENNSAEINDFYRKIKSADEFNYQNLPTRPLELNREILNIIGYRLNEIPDAKISIFGYADSISEGGDCQLARRRAKSVKDYLTKIWKISPERIYLQIAEENCVPANKTITQNDSGFSENRRVEISSNNPGILEPIARRRYLEILDYEPDTLVFDPTQSRGVGIRNWKIEILRGANPILTFAKGSNLEVINEKIGNTLLDFLSQNEVLTARLTIQDEFGNIATDSKPIKIINDTSEYEIQRLSLILFDVSSAVIPKSKKEEIEKFLMTNSELTQARIIGYSDILGDKDFNFTLSEKRAKNVLDLVKSIDPSIEILEAKGVGSSVLPPGISSYSTPAERFLSRTVYIELIKKWK